MDMTQTIEIPVLALRAATKEGYFDVIDHFLKNRYNHEQAYNATEELLREYFGENRYSSYTSFRRIMSYRRKK